MAKSSEHATGPFMASAFRVRQFVRENCLANRPSVVKMCNSMLRSNSKTLGRVLKADLNINLREPARWTAQVLDAFQGLRRCDSFAQAVLQGTPISIQEVTDNLRHMLRAV
eukprot:482419-Pelagomonas_calceolata.AAC.1